jgi:DNA-binding CsgD family transcriptional regulator
LAGLDRAARECLLSSPEAAVQLALRALELTDPDDEARHCRAAIAVDALLGAGQVVEAAKRARSMLAEPPAPAAVAAHLRLILSSTGLLSGDRAEALRCADAVLNTGGLPAEFYDTGELFRILAVLSQGDVERAGELAGSVLAGSKRPIGDAAMTGALTALAFFAWWDGRMIDTVGFLRAAVQRSDRAPESTRIHPRLTLATVLASLGELDEAFALVTAAEELSQLSGDTLWTAGVAVVRARLRLFAGQLDDASAEAERGLRAAQQTATRAFMPVGEWVLAAVARYHDQLAEATHHVERYQAELPAIEGSIGSAAYVLTYGCVLDARDGPSRALDVLSLLFDEPAAHNAAVIGDPSAGAFLVRTALAAGDRQRALTAVTLTRLLADKNPGFPSLDAAASQALGLFNQDLVQLERAANVHRHPWARASAHEDLAILLAKTNDSAAVTRFDQALAGYQKLGATRDVVRIEGRLREIRAHHGHRVRRQRAVGGWPSLSDAELTVAELVAQGLTNPQVAERLFISRHTVDFHMRQIFRKLNVSSRIELTRLVVERNDETP